MPVLTLTKAQACHYLCDASNWYYDVWDSYMEDGCDADAVSKAEAAVYDSYKTLKAGLTVDVNDEFAKDLTKPDDLFKDEDLDKVMSSVYENIIHKLVYPKWGAAKFPPV